MQGDTSCSVATLSLTSGREASGHYLNGVLDLISNDFCQLAAEGFANPLVDLPDGVHLNSTGQDILYRSYPGAILR